MCVYRTCNICLYIPLLACVPVDIAKRVLYAVPAVLMGCVLVRGTPSLHQRVRRAPVHRCPQPPHIQDSVGHLSVPIPLFSFSSPHPTITLMAKGHASHPIPYSRNRETRAFNHRAMCLRRGCYPPVAARMLRPPQVPSLRR